MSLIVTKLILEVYIFNAYSRHEHLATEDVADLKHHQSMTTALLGFCIANMCELTKNLQRWVKNAEKKRELIDLELKNLKQEAEKRNELMDLKIKCLELKMRRMKSKAQQQQQLFNHRGCLARGKLLERKAPGKERERKASGKESSFLSSVWKYLQQDFDSTLAFVNHERKQRSEEHECLVEGPLNNLKQSMVQFQKPKNIYNDRRLFFGGGPGIMPNDNFGSVGSSSPNTDRRSSRARGLFMPPGPPNGTHKPGVHPAGYPMPRVLFHFTRLPLLNHMQFQLEEHYMDQFGAVPHVPQPGARGFGAGRGNAGAPIGSHLQHQQSSQQAIGGLRSAFNFPALENPSSQPSVGGPLSQPGFITNGF